MTLAIKGLDASTIERYFVERSLPIVACLTRPAAKSPRKLPAPLWEDAHSSRILFSAMEGRNMVTAMTSQLPLTALYQPALAPWVSGGCSLSHLILTTGILPVTGPPTCLPSHVFMSLINAFPPQCTVLTWKADPQGPLGVEVPPAPACFIIHPYTALCMEI